MRTKRKWICFDACRCIWLYLGAFSV